MPMIDLNPGDLSCIYSTLRFVTAQASRCRMTPVITFDQPLYLKALSIISSEEAGRELNSIVLRLGCFHTQMSFLGSTGYLMAGSGLQEAMELVFAPNAVIHMLSGKAYDHAVRSHLLVDAALNSLITADAFQLPWILIHHDAEDQAAKSQEECMEVTEDVDDNQEDQVSAMRKEVTGTPDDSFTGHSSVVERAEAASSTTEDTEAADQVFKEAHARTGDSDLDTATVLLQKVLQGDIPRNVEMRETFSKFATKLQTHRESLLKCRTGGLWLQYLDMVDR